MQPENAVDEDRPPAAVSRSQAFLDAVLALLLAVLSALVAPLAGHFLIAALGMPLLLVVVQGLIILGGLQVLLALRGQGWRDIRLRPLRAKDIGLALLALLLVFAVNVSVSVAGLWLASGSVAAHQERLSAFARLLAGDVSLLLVGGVMLFTGLYEEMLARGFLLARWRVLLPGVWGPVLLSSVLFGLGHFYQGWFGVVQTALVGVVFARLVLRWDTLWPAILAHAALNTFALAAFRALAPAA